MNHQMCIILYQKWVKLYVNMGFVPKHKNCIFLVKNYTLHLIYISESIDTYLLSKTIKLPQNDH